MNMSKGEFIKMSTDEQIKMESESALKFLGTTSMSSVIEHSSNESKVSTPRLGIDEIDLAVGITLGYN
jgi:hypothetical protein